MSFSANPAPIQNYASICQVGWDVKHAHQGVYVVQMDEKFAYYVVAYIHQGFWSIPNPIYCN